MHSKGIKHVVIIINEVVHYVQAQTHTHLPSLLQEFAMEAIYTVSYEHMHSTHGIMNTCKSTNEVVHKHTDTWLQNFTIWL